MIKKELKLTTGESVVIYDDVFDRNEVDRLQIFLESSLYTIGSSSRHTMQKSMDYFFRSSFSDDDLTRFGFFENNEVKHIVEENELFGNSRYWALISTHMSQYQYHVDLHKKGGKTLLYYANSFWDINWGGETIFCNIKGEVELAVEFKPNRIVVFDNHIEHKSASLSASSYPYRHIFVAQFINRGENAHV